MKRKDKSTIEIIPILLKIVNKMDFDTISEEWTELDIDSFSKDIRIWDFQVEALRNCIKGLYLYYFENNASKAALYQKYIEFGLTPEIEDKITMLPTKNNSDMLVYFDYYYKIHSTNPSKVSFEHFINRQAFWMATGSGKSIIIIKLIQILNTLMQRNCIPKNDILLLTHREDLITQFIRHIHEFNEFQAPKGISIKLVSLKDFESEKKQRSNPTTNQILVFYYRSDLLRDEDKEAILDFRNYENDGKWFVILDEAHKGDKEESKRQMIFSIMARSGFLFNFSATFVESSDIITTVYNYNLEKFITNGYGKHIFISNIDIKGFSSKKTTETAEFEKRVTILKSLILLTYIKLGKKNLPKSQSLDYHEPILLTLVNTVNFSKIKEEISDLMLLFQEMKQIAENQIESTIMNKALTQLIEELQDNTLIYENTNTSIDYTLISSIDIKKIRYYVFHAEEPSALEILCIPDNDKEILLKVKNAHSFFALIKIGEAKTWMMENLRGYEITESYEYKEIFKDLDRKEEISILLGSRAFYEGWDSNRPNILLFINIGKAVDSKKFITQAIGRGIRIEPIRTIRKRLQFIDIEKTKAVPEENNKNPIDSIETLFVFGTNAEILQEVINTLKIPAQHQNESEESQSKNNTPYINDMFHHDRNIKKYAQMPLRFSLSKANLEDLNEIFNTIDPRILICMYNVPISTLTNIKNALIPENQNLNFNIVNDSINKQVLVTKLLSFFQRNRL